MCSHKRVTSRRLGLFAHRLLTSIARHAIYARTQACLLQLCRKHLRKTPTCSGFTAEALIAQASRLPPLPTGLAPSNIEFRRAPVTVHRLL